jgi:hypothetical protein
MMQDTAIEIVGLVLLGALTAAYTDLRIKASKKRQQINEFVADKHAIGKLLDDVFPERVGTDVANSNSGTGSNHLPRAEDIQEGHDSPEVIGDTTTTEQAGFPISGVVHSIPEVGKQDGD